MQTLIRWAGFTIFVVVMLVYARWVMVVNKDLRIELEGGGSQDVPQQTIAACKTAIFQELGNPRSVDWGDSQLWPSSHDAPLWTIGATFGVEDRFGKTTVVSAVCETLHGRVKVRLMN